MTNDVVSPLWGAIADAHARTGKMVTLHVSRRGVVTARVGLKNKVTFGKGAGEREVAHDLARLAERAGKALKTGGPRK